MYHHIRPKVASWPVTVLRTREREEYCGSRAIIRRCSPLKTVFEVFCWPVSEQGKPYYCLENQLLELLCEVSEFLETRTCNDYLESVDVAVL